MTNRADIIQSISKAATLAEQASLVGELEAFDRKQAQANADGRSIDLAAATVRETLRPAAVHEFHTAATDWIGDVESSQDGQRQIMAEAAMWFGRVSPEVKADSDEFREQAIGFMRREAGRYGEQAQAYYASGLNYLSFLHKQAASGLDQVQQTTAPDGVTNKSTPLPTDVFDNFAPPVHPINEGVSGTEDSNRSPLLQEIEQEGASPSAPEWHNDDWASGYEGHPNPEPIERTSVALGYVMNMDDFRAAQAHEAASGLDQVQQTTAPDGVTNKPTALPVDVMFPWTTNGGQEMADDESQGTSAMDKAMKQGRLDDASGCRLCDGELGPVDEKTGKATCKDCGTSMGIQQKSSRLPFEGSQAPEGVSKQTAKLKMAPEHIETLRSAVTPLDTDERREKYRNGDYPRSEAVQDHDKRYRWDLLWGAHKGEHGDAVKDAINTGYDNGVNDSHIDSALKTIVKPLGPKQSAKKTADMFGNSDAPHAVPQPGVAKEDTEIPQSPADTVEAGKADGLAGLQPAVSDGNTHPNYAKGYAEGLAESKSNPKSTPPGAGKTGGADNYAACPAHEGQSYNKSTGDCSCGSNHNKWASSNNPDGKQSSLTVEADNPAFGPNAKGDVWDSDADVKREKTPASTKAEDENRFGTVVGAADPSKGHGDYDDHVFSPRASDGQVCKICGFLQSAHAKQSSLRVSAAFVGDEAFDQPDFVKAYKFASKWTKGDRLVTTGSAEFEAGLYAGISDNPAAQSAWVKAHKGQAMRNASLAERLELHEAFTESMGREGMYVQAGTTTDLATTAPDASPAADGSTPINGPGRPGPLDGKQEVNAPAGAAPYNGAEPFGKSVVPSVHNVTQPSAKDFLIDDRPGGPVDGNKARALAFRQVVQANLLLKEKSN